MAILVDRPPQIPQPALNADKQLVEVPGISLPAAPASQLPGVLQPKGLAPLTNRLVCHGDPTLGEQVLDVAKAEVEPVVQPHGVTDDLRREAVSSVARHPGTVPDWRSTCTAARHSPVRPAGMAATSEEAVR